MLVDHDENVSEMRSKFSSEFTLIWTSEDYFTLEHTTYNTISTIT